MNSENKFRTHLSSYCHILPDKIVFTETDKLDNPLDNGYPYLFNLVKFFYAVFGIYLLYIGIKDFFEGDQLMGIFFIVYGFFTFGQLIYKFWHSWARIISRKQIIDIELKEPIKYWRLHQISILFLDKRGNVRKRIATIDEIGIARQVLRKHGLI